MNTASNVLGCISPNVFKVRDVHMLKQTAIYIDPYLARIQLRFISLILSSAFLQRALLVGPSAVRSTTPPGRAGHLCADSCLLLGFLLPLTLR